MTLPSEPGLAKAALHYRRAGEYHELAQGLLARAAGNTGTAAADIRVAAGGTLLYEAAKQCVNSVANLNGRDPQANHEKMAALRAIANAHPAYPNLIDDSRTAWELHIHADQDHLTQRELTAYTESTRRLVMDLRSIYRATAPPP